MAQHRKNPAEDGVPPPPRPKHLPLIARAAPPELLPARMLNEVLYCERLMHLEWVQHEFADNAFTVEGRYVHRRADAAGGMLPPVPSANASSHDSTANDDDASGSATGAEPVPYEARSVWLSSAKLGLTAKIDLVEGNEAGTVVPIEYKRGRAPDIAEGVYLPERGQICAHALLLREHGYRCDEGAVYFAASRKRVAVPITDSLVASTLAAIARAREVAQAPEPPPPLHDSPKCRGCSLVGICLPDEVNLLRRLRGEGPVERDEVAEQLEAVMEQLEGPLEPDPWGLAGSAPLRRLHPARDDRVPLYVQDYRSRVGVSGQRLVVQGGEGAQHARLMNTSQVAVFGNVQITAQALRALLERGIPVSFHTAGGWLVGRATGTESNNVDLRLAQYRRASDPDFCLGLARRVVVSKLKNARTMIRRNHGAPDPVVLGQLKQLARKAAVAESLDALLGLEGSGARVYFQSFTGMLKNPDGIGTFDLESRNRRPPRDPVNALLSFVYAMLARELTNTCGSVGLDPLLGFYHQPRFGRPALALDLMEELRPIVADSVVIGAINTGVVGAGDFVHAAGSCNLAAGGRRKVLDAFERRMDQEVIHPVFGYRISYRRVLEVQARLLSRVLLGELDTYPTFGTR